MSPKNDRSSRFTRTTPPEQALDARVDVRTTRAKKERLQELAAERGPKTDVSDIVREMIDFSLEGPSMDLPSVSAMLAEAAQSGELQDALMSGGLRLPVLGSAPCGPFRDVVAETSVHHFLSPATVEWLEASPRDVLIVADGQSMEGAGIPNGALLILRPLPAGGRPQNNEVALVQIIDDQGNCTSTLKRWVQSEPLVLHNGDGQAIELPKNMKEAIPVAVVRSIISRYK